jgi:formylmethanofuran dehydrogenase subunit C
VSVALFQREDYPFGIDLRGVLPDRLADLAADAIAALPIAYGCRSCALGELYDVRPLASAPPGLLEIHTRGRGPDYVGAGLVSGTIRVHGNVGDQAGEAMEGGTLHVAGDAGHGCGGSLRDGLVLVEGDAGDRLGAPRLGARIGQAGGVIVVRGRAGARAGERQRRGLLLIEGDAGDLAGHRMIAGTLYVGGVAGAMTGYAMQRGTLVLRHPPRGLCGTLADNGTCRLGFLPLLWRELQHASDGRIGPLPADGHVQRYLGDLASDGRGEVLVTAPVDHGPGGAPRSNDNPQPITQP